jgi:hypothetical protein
VKLPLGQHSQRSWVFVPTIINNFILGLDALHTHTVLVDVEQCMLQLDEQEVLLWHLRL